MRNWIWILLWGGRNYFSARSWRHQRGITNAVGRRDPIRRRRATRLAQILLHDLLSVTDRARQQDLANVMRIQAGDVLLGSCSQLLLGLDYLDIVSHALSETVLRLPKRLLRKIKSQRRHFHLLSGCLQVEEGILNILLDASPQIVHFRAALLQNCLGLANVSLHLS